MEPLNYDPLQLSLLRDRQRLSTGQVALMLDLPVAIYEALEQGSGTLTAAQLQKLALLFRVSAAELQGQPAPVKKKKKLSKRAREKRDAAQRRTDPEYISDEELAEAQAADPTATRESLRFLKFIAGLIVESTLGDLRLKSRLQKEPGGFHPEYTRPCAICGDYVSNEKAWFDADGHTCLHCHQAITGGIIPGVLTTDSGLFYKESELEMDFMLDKKMLNGLIRDKLVRPRLIRNKDGQGTHIRIFLHADNPNFFPPRELLKGGIVRETNAEGLEEFVFPPWYHFVDPNEHLKDYGISKVMRWESDDPAP